MIILKIFLLLSTSPMKKVKRSTNGRLVGCFLAPSFCKWLIVIGDSNVDVIVFFKVNNFTFGNYLFTLFFFFWQILRKRLFKLFFLPPFCEYFQQRVID